MDKPSHSQGLWRHSEFLKLWSGQTVSEVGSRITRDGLPLSAVLVLGATPSQMGLMAAIGSLPILLTGWLAGVWVDRLQRRPLMIAADLGRGLLLATIPLAAVLGLLTLWQLYVVLVLTSLLTVVFDIAYQAYLPSLVDRENIVEGNSKLALSSAAAEVAGPGLTGFLVQLLTAPIAILLDALSFFVSVLTLILINKPEPPASAVVSRRDVRGEAIEGLRVLLGNRVLRALTLGSGTRAFFGNFIGALITLYAIRELGLSAAALGITIAAGGAGDLIAALVAEPMARRWGTGRTLIGAFVVSGLFTFLVPLAGGPPVVAMALLMAAQFFGDMLRTTYMIHEVSLRQAITPDRWLGRTNASYQMIIQGIGPLGALLGGALGELIGLRATLMIAAIGGLGGAVWLILSPIRSLGHITEQRQQPPT